MHDIAETAKFRAVVSVDADELDSDVANFSTAYPDGEPDRLRVRFESADDAFAPWVGIFQRGYSGSWAVEAVIPFAWDATRCLVVAAGQGYIVNTEAREAVALEHPFPITFVERIDLHSFVVAADLTSVAAIGADGVVWINSDLGDGELFVDGINAANVVGRGWAAPFGEFRRFTIDLASGTLAN